MKRLFPLLIVISLILFNCVAKELSSAKVYMQQGMMNEQEPLTISLFKSDQVILDDETIKKILNGRIELSQQAKVALIKLNAQQTNAIRYYGYYYWRSEDYLKLQQEYVDTFSALLLKSQRIKEVVLLPSMLIPKEPTISTIREAAVRLQADLAIIFNITSDIYQKYGFWGANEVKSFSTCEIVLIDIRTGIIPFTSVVTQDFLAKKGKTDLNIEETSRRAEKAAVLKSIETVGSQMVIFFDNEVEEKTE
jgi:hypothetical protein